jgi:hypothetical protein
LVRVEFNPTCHLVLDPGCEPTAHHQVRLRPADQLPVEVILLYLEHLDLRTDLPEGYRECLAVGVKLAGYQDASSAYGPIISTAVELSPHQYRLTFSSPIYLTLGAPDQHTSRSLGELA